MIKILKKSEQYPKVNNQQSNYTSANGKKYDATIKPQVVSMK